MSGRIAVLSLLLIALSACQSTAQNAAISTPLSSSGTFACFSTEPPQGTVPTTCDSICAAEGAVCTAVQSIVTPSGCDLPAGDMGRCRCCKGAP